MVDIKVGDWVKLNWWVDFYEVVEVASKQTHITLEVDGKKIMYANYGTWIIRDNPTPSPVREVVTKELVDGVYGRVKINKTNLYDENVLLKLSYRSGKFSSEEVWKKFNAKELRELAKTLNEVAEFLEGE